MSYTFVQTSTIHTVVIWVHRLHTLHSQIVHYAVTKSHTLSTHEAHTVCSHLQIALITWDRIPAIVKHLTTHMNLFQTISAIVITCFLHRWNLVHTLILQNYMRSYITHAGITQVTIKYAAIIRESYCFTWSIHVWHIALQRPSLLLHGTCRTLILTGFHLSLQWIIKET